MVLQLVKFPSHARQTISVSITEIKHPWPNCVICYYKIPETRLFLSWY